MPSWPLASTWVTVLLAVAAGVLVLRAAPRSGGCGGRRTVAAALLALAMLSYANSYFSYLPELGDLLGPRPWPSAPASEVLTSKVLSAPGGASRSPVHTRPRGAVVSLDLAGPRSGAPTRAALAYLPPQYFTDPGRRFPILYLLHGSPGAPLDWFRSAAAADAGLQAARSGSPVILIAPRMSSGWLSDSECVDGPELRAESYLVDDVVPEVDGMLRTVATADGRGLAGNSAGGYCALTVALRHPDQFSAVLAMSALTAPSYSYGSLSTLFGHPPDLAQVVAEHTPAWLLENRPQARRVALRLDVGSREPALRRRLEQLASIDRAVGGTPELLVRPGGHTYHVWRPGLRDGVAWFAARTSPSTNGDGPGAPAGAPVAPGAPQAATPAAVSAWERRPAATRGRA